MKQHSPTSPTSEALEARVALRIASVLSDAEYSLPHDVTERLRFARENALERARASRSVAVAPTVLGNVGAAVTLGASGARGGWFGSSGGWWLRLASVVPLIALVGGLVLIQNFHISSQITAAADVDTALLSDELPPAAYTDAGFVEFLKTARN